MGKIVAIVNQKGGVGKTTTAVNLAASLALLDFRVLLIDADPQGNASSGVGVYPDDNTVSIYDCIVNGKMANEAVVETKTPNLFVMPATIHLVGAEIEMINFDRREYRMRDALTDVKNDFDFIFIDCAPSCRPHRSLCRRSACWDHWSRQVRDANGTRCSVLSPDR